MNVRYVLTDGEFAAVTGFLGRVAGLVFDDSRRSSLTATVLERVSETAGRGVDSYLATISDDGGAAELQVLLDAVTIPETQFLRNPPQMAALRDALLPELLRRASDDGRPLRVWSAGCSTGEEPYSIALLAAEACSEIGRGVEVDILATDINSRCLAATDAARYSGRSLAAVDSTRLAKWFETSDDETYTVNQRLRSMVRTAPQNLVTDPLPFPDDSLDLIVCRNVTIYFDRATTVDLVNKFHRGLRPEGYLLIGHSETLWRINDAFTVIPLAEAFAYRKVPHAEVVAPRVSRPPRVPSQKPPVPRIAPPPQRSGSDLLAQARQAVDRADYVQAARLAERASGMDPLDVESHVVAGWARATVGDDDGALAALRRAIYLDPRAGHARFLLAGVLSRTGNQAAAGREYRAAAETLPSTDPEALRSLLDGCAVQELVHLCSQRADEIDMGVRP